ncbi:MAG: PAS domain S-box protein, partial [Deltaproteobacteria bacterium]
MSQLLAGEFDTYSMEKRYFHKQGQIIWVLLSVSLVRGSDKSPLYFISQIENITVRKQAQDALKKSEEILSLFMKHSPIYAYIKEVTSCESRVLQASENFEKMIGIPGSKMGGKVMSELFPSELANKITEDDWKVVSNGDVLEVEEQFNDHIYHTIKFP